MSKARQQLGRLWLMWGLRLLSGQNLAILGHPACERPVPRLNGTSQALLCFQSGPMASVPFTCCPVTRQSSFDSQVLRVLLLRRLWLPLDERRVEVLADGLPLPRRPSGCGTPHWCLCWAAMESHVLGVRALMASSWRKPRAGRSARTLSSQEGTVEHVWWCWRRKCAAGGPQTRCTSWRSWPRRRHVTNHVS